MSFDTIQDTEQQMNDEQKLLWDRLFNELDEIKDTQKNNYLDHEKRLNSLEKWQYKILGAAAVISAVAPFIYEALK